ncbi:MAG TPA: hypothetical protein VG826_06415 [Pirellulales bacterium]|nr:hypothetical protein [Pirellulales bacterium]
MTIRRSNRAGAAIETAIDTVPKRQSPAILGGTVKVNHATLEAYCAGRTENVKHVSGAIFF